MSSTAGEGRPPTRRPTCCSASPGRWWRSRGVVEDADIAAVRDAGYGDAEIAEVVAHVALNIFTNYFNNVAGTAIDFPKAPALSA